MAITSFNINPAVLATAGDPDGTRTIISIIALLVAIGFALVLVAVWLFKSTRPDLELLAPLEVMGERGWRRSEPLSQRRRLDELRVEGAEPLEPVAAPPAIDEAYDHGPAADGFADLDLEVEEAVESEEVSDATVAIPVAAVSRAADPTPPAVDRPEFDGLSNTDFDPELLAEAAAQLELELGIASGDEVEATSAD